LFKDNPFTWDNTSSTISSNVIDIMVESILNISSSNMSEDVAVTIFRDPAQFGEDASFFLKPDEMNSTSNAKEYFKFHCFTRRSNFTAMNFEVRISLLDVRILMFVVSAVASSIIGGLIFIYSCSALLISFEIDIYV
jgi:hypothetical protein